jgi:hypothetical protein
MSQDPKEILRAAGLDNLPAAQRRVFDDLTPAELEVVGAVQSRLNSAAPEVEGMANNNNNTLC